MRFRFIGDGDCPDWILAEINTLSRLSSVKLKLIGQIICQGIINPPFQVSKIEVLFEESKLDASSYLESCTACLSFLLSSATRYNCDSIAFQSELQQLGLPREHSNSLKRVYDEYKVRLTETFKNQSLKHNYLESVLAVAEPETGCASLDLKIQGEHKSITITPGSVDQLLSELRYLKKVMTDLKEVPM